MMFTAGIDTDPENREPHAIVFRVLGCMVAYFVGMLDGNGKLVQIQLSYAALERRRPKYILVR